MLVSVIVPVYKVEKYIYRCIDSILVQTFTDFELILVDDGSPDNCGKICDEYAEKDNRIHVIHKENGGLSDARNVGIDWVFEHSNSEWITFIDSDDWIHPRYLEALYDAVKSTGCEISICGFERTEGDEPAVDDTKLRAVSVNSEDFFCNHNVNAVVAWGKLYKKELFREIRYPVGKLHEDEFTTYKLLFQYENCAFVNQPMYFYFQNTESITKSKWSIKRLDGLEALSYQIEFFSIHRKERAYSFLLKHYTYSLLCQISSVSDSDNDTKKLIINGLTKKLKLHLKLCNHNGLFRFSDDNSKFIYEIAYPTEMKVYWYWQAVKRKLKRK